MIPNEEQLEAISHMRAGNLAEIPFGVLLHALAAHHRSGVLEIERGPLKKEIFLEDGTPVDCRSNLLHETLGRFMATRGDLDEEQYQRCLAKSAARGLRFGETLILEGLINASDLYKVLQQNLAKKLLDGFSWRSGEFRVSNQLPAVDSPLKVNTAQLVVTGISKFTLDEEVDEAVGPLVGKKLYLHPQPHWPLSEIRLTPEQTQLIELLHDGKRIDQMAAETTIPFGNIMRLLYSLAVIGIVVPEDRLPPELPQVDVEPEPPPPPEPQAEDKSPLDTLELRGVELERLRLAKDEIEAHRNAVMEAYLRYRGQDAFELLEVEEESTLPDIERRYIEVSRRFAPWRFDIAGLSSLMEKAEDLYLAAGRAFGELCDPERRNTLIMRRRTLRKDGERKPAADRFAIKSELLDSELQFKRGVALMQKGRYRDAQQQLQFAFDCDPQNSIYRAELAYCTFLASPKTAGRSAFEELEETLRIDPRCGLAVYYAGMVGGEVGEIEKAEKYLRKAIKLMMPDRRPIEGLKALQAKSKKRRLL